MTDFTAQPQPPEGSINDRLRTALSRLVELTAHRASTEQEIARKFDAATHDARRTQEEKLRAIDAAFRTALAEHEGEANQSTRTLDARVKAEQAALEREYAQSRAGMIEKAAVNERAARKGLQEAIWLAETVYEASENQPQERYDLAATYARGKLQAMQTIRQQAETLLTRCRIDPARLPAPEAPEPLNGETIDDVQVTLERDLAEADRLLASLRALKLPRLFHSLRLPAIIVVAAMLAIGVAAWLTKGDWSFWPWVAAGGAMVVCVAASLVMYGIAKKRAAGLYRPLSTTVSSGSAAAAAYIDLAAGIREREKEELIETRERELRNANEKFLPIIAEIQERRDGHLKRLDEKYPAQIDLLKQRHAQERAQLRERIATDRARIHGDRDEATAAANEAFERAASGATQIRDREWSALERTWLGGMRAIREVMDEASGRDRSLFAPWSDPSWEKATPAAEAAEVVRFGKLHIDMNALEGGAPADPRLQDGGPTAFDIPASLAFPDECSLVVSATPETRRAAIVAVQNLMLRLVTALPAGKVRFTLIDPIGLGQNFAGFMHLADHMESLVGDRILTETRHIEQRLADLTEHMENVIQKYLRNEFRTIAEYNREAGEIAEPYRFVVIADFPANFNDNCARRLASVLTSGARCGVYAIIISDPRASLPNGITDHELRHGCVRLVADKNEFRWDDPALARFPLSLEAPPDEERLTAILHNAGKAAKAASRVEVPFHLVAPRKPQMWSMDSASSLRAPIGRMGATKLQYLTLGQGVSQHVLIAGKTGSGKSTLLHAMITSLAMWYSPDQVEFYLIDFKKGVEFKTYASLELPHARAVAIESDREFGLSVLQRLDGELRRRGQIFRDLEVQDLAGYRRAKPDGPPMPRTLLVIDEFQEFFSEDDKLAQDAGLLLDRLVRQGRAFGIHVILGSQTLGGAYTLARATMGQMAVRIALQCSEADAHLILSDDNAAARLLSRPGEAIYNDAGGLVEGNSPFQIVWLSDEEREGYLAGIRETAHERRALPTQPAIVFEGNVPADLNRCGPLQAALHQPDWPAAPSAPAAWLGEAIAIKDATAATFRRQAGANLLMVGQQEESALAMMTTTLVSLAAQHAPNAAKFYILDGSTPDAPHQGYLSALAAVVPHAVVNVGYREVPEVMAAIAEEADRRREAGDAAAESIYLLVYGIQRFRMLRRGEDDFGFSTAEKAVAPDRHFTNILKEGAVHGVHVVVWCDTLNNLNRTFDRQALREFDQRILFQMSANDSSALIDSPAAGRLGPRRAFYHSEELGQLEKFRPFGLPESEWLQMARRKLRGRAALAT
jgi:DNA segregation ATPase FtsK/SpoIIIE, S-DNA-T family